MTIRAVDLVTRLPLPEGEIGELAVRGYITPGYYRAPELDAEAFDRDGYFLTGDLGTIEADGGIRFRGRLKEMIKQSKPAIFRSGILAFSCSMNSRRRASALVCSTPVSSSPKNSYR